MKNRRTHLTTVLLQETVAKYNKKKDTSCNNGSFNEPLLNVIFNNGSLKEPLLNECAVF
jgi:hypothetical protein